MATTTPPHNGLDRVGPFDGPWLTILSVLAALVATNAVRVFDLPVWLPVAAFVAAGTGQALADRARKVRRGAIVYQALCVVGAGTWATWTAWQGFSLNGWIALGLPAILAVSISPWFAADRFEDRTTPALAPTRSKDPVGVEWERMLNEVLRTKDGQGVDIQSVAHWPGRTGYTVTVEFPPGSYLTYRSVQAIEGMPGALRLKKGCTIKVDEGDHQGSAVIKVATVNDLDKTHPFPTTYLRRSVREDFPIGVYRDRAPALIDAYQSSGVIVGKRGAGKTICLQCITASLAQCEDAVVWLVDLNGGGMASPWLRPYALGQIDRPAVDWVATTPDEAIRVATVGLAIAKDRKARYQGLLVENNTDILPVSPTLPAIVILVDEGAEVLGEDASKEAQRAAEALRELQRIGRAMCINVIFSVMRGTHTNVPAGMKKLTNTKIVFGVDDDAELAHVFDWSKGVRAADLTQPGSAFVRRGTGGAPEMMKGYGLLPQQMADISRVTEDWHPELDAPAQKVGGKTYAERWQRDDTHHWLQVLAGVEPDVDLADARPVDVEAKVAGELSMTVMAEGLKRFGEQFKQTLAEQANRPSQLPPDAREIRPATQDWLRGELESIATWPGDEPQPDDEEAAPEPEASKGPLLERGLQLVVQVLNDNAPDGVKTDTIFRAAEAANLTERRATVNGWLTEALARGLVERTKYATWIAAKPSG